MRLAYCWLRLWDGVRFPVKQYRGEIKRLSRHRGGYLDDTCEILFFSISFFFFSPYFYSPRSLLNFSSVHSSSLYLSIYSPFISRFTDPSTKRLPRGHYPGEIQLFTWISRSSFFFFSLFDSIRMRLIALKPFLWIKIAIWDASIYTTTYIIQYVCSF